jgi:hypothetical protein
MQTTPRSADWRKSTYSSNGADCVEVAFQHAGTGVRDSKNVDGGHLAIASEQWTAFIASVKHGE